MAAWTTITDAVLAIGKGIKSTTIKAIRDNITALAEGASGAPSIEEAAMAAASVNQSALKTSILGEVSTGLTRESLTLPGGTYGFYPQIKMSATTNQDWQAGNVLGDVTGSGLHTNQGGWTTYTTEIQLGRDSAGSGTISARQRYVTASPPYDLGDGEVPLFVFAKINDGTGEVESVYVAADPPWAYNGPTDIAATHRTPDGTPMQRRLRMPPTPFDQMTPAQAEAWLAQVVDDRFEVVPVDQALKQADMPDIPHPFMGNDLTGKSIVLIDPVSDLCANLAERHARGQDINALLHEGQLVIDNVEVARATPPGVLAHPVKWKNTP